VRYKRTLFQRNDIEIHMSDRPSAKKIFKIVSLGLRSMRDNKDSREVEGTFPAGKKITKKFNQLVNRAFRDGGLNRKRKDDWDVLTISLVIAVYAGGDGPGAPTKWTKAKLRRLLADVETKRKEIWKSKRPTDQDCCDELIKVPPYKNMTGEHFMPLEASSLRRKLPEARKLTQTGNAPADAEPTPPFDEAPDVSSGVGDP
jgi:hypothetical protein